MEDYELHKQLYKGKASLLYRATCRLSGTLVALKLYRKARLSELNWYQVSCPHPKEIVTMTRSIYVKRTLLRRSLLQRCSPSRLSLTVARDVQVQREIRIHSQLQHEHIIAFYAAFEDSEHVYLALEYAAGAYPAPSLGPETAFQSLP